MNYYIKIFLLFVLLCLSILNCPLIFHFISIRGGFIIFHYWFIFILMFMYNYYLLNVEKYHDEKKTKISKQFYEAINENTNKNMRLAIYYIYASLFLTIIFIAIYSIYYDDTYMSLAQKIVYFIDFVTGTILTATIKEHDYFHIFLTYENIFIINDESKLNKIKSIIEEKNDEKILV